MSKKRASDDATSPAADVTVEQSLSVDDAAFTVRARRAVRHHSLAVTMLCHSPGVVFEYHSSPPLRVSTRDTLVGATTLSHLAVSLPVTPLTRPLSDGTGRSRVDAGGSGKDLVTRGSVGTCRFLLIGELVAQREFLVRKGSEGVTVHHRHHVLLPNRVE